MVITAGGVVIEILETNGFVVAANRTNLDAWVNAYHLPVTALVDPPGAGTATLSAYGIRESVFVVDLATMRIVRKFNGSVAGIGQSAIGQAVPVILGLLGH